MNIQILKRIDKAPKSGLMLLYLRDKVEFKEYNCLDELKLALGDKDILEIHLFDNNKEYRAIASTSKRFPSGVIEDISDFEYADDRSDCVKTESLVAESWCKEVAAKVAVINHVSYDENGMAMVDNYRLVRGDR